MQGSSSKQCSRPHHAVAPAYLCSLMQPPFPSLVLFLPRVKICSTSVSPAPSFIYSFCVVFKNLKKRLIAKLKMALNSHRLAWIPLCNLGWPELNHPASVPSYLNIDPYQHAQYCLIS